MTPYCDIATADAYFADRLHTETWDALGSSDAGIITKNKALKHATSILERLNYIGAKADDSQELQFPRGTDTVIPTDMKNACAECAISLLDGIDPDLEFKNLQETLSHFANIKSTRDASQFAEHILAGVPSIVAWRLIKPYLPDNRTVNLLRIS